MVREKILSSGKINEGNQRDRVRLPATLCSREPRQDNFLSHIRPHPLFQKQALQEKLWWQAIGFEESDENSQLTGKVLFSSDEHDSSPTAFHEKGQMSTPRRGRSKSRSSLSHFSCADSPKREEDNIFSEESLTLGNYTEYGLLRLPSILMVSYVGPFLSMRELGRLDCVCGHFHLPRQSLRQVVPGRWHSTRLNSQDQEECLSITESAAKTYCKAQGLHTKRASVAPSWLKTMRPHLDWMETLDSAAGFRNCVMAPSLRFAVSKSNIWKPGKRYSAPDGYRWCYASEAEELCCDGSGYGPKVYFNQAGWYGTNFRGLERQFFRFADSHLNGSYKHVCSREQDPVHYGNFQVRLFAGIVCVVNPRSDTTTAHHERARRTVSGVGVDGGGGGYDASSNSGDTGSGESSGDCGGSDSGSDSGSTSSKDHRHSRSIGVAVSLLSVGSAITNRDRRGRGRGMLADSQTVLGLIPVNPRSDSKSAIRNRAINIRTTGGTKGLTATTSLPQI